MTRTADKEETNVRSIIHAEIRALTSKTFQ